MKEIQSLLNYYGINDFYIKDEEKLNLVIKNRSKSLTLNEWINLINSLKYISKKEVIFLNDNNLNLNEFNHVRSDD